FSQGVEKVAAVSYEIWQTHFGGAADIVGKTIRLNGESYVVVGVAPPDFEFLGRMDIWMPLTISRGDLNWQSRDLLVVGRTKPRVSAVQAREEMRTLASRVAQESPETNRRWSALAQSFQ